MLFAQFLSFLIADGIDYPLISFQRQPIRQQWGAFLLTFVALSLSVDKQRKLASPSLPMIDQHACGLQRRLVAFLSSLPALPPVFGHTNPTLDDFLTDEVHAAGWIYLIGDSLAVIGPLIRSKSLIIFAAC